MKMWRRSALTGAALHALLCVVTQIPALAQAGAPGNTGTGEACGLVSPSFATSSANIFSPQQEQDLADALAEFTESDMHLVNPGTNDQLTRIGERLLAALPPSGLHYHFRIYDSGEVNGFSIGGGRVYISRKLIVAVKNEDELAGVLAHEIGHIATHQTARDFTRLLRIRLGVTKVTDRADIFAKLHLLMSTPAKPGEDKDEEQKDQLVADHVGFYAMVRAGYAPESFASFLDESMINKGKTGNWLSNMLGSTRESATRYRSALKLIDALAPGCKGKPPVTNAVFTAWQKNLVEDRGKAETATADGDKPVKLDPPLRPSLWRIRFSPNGRYLLAQDEGSVAVVDRNAQKVLLRIDAPDAEEAQFTPDSQSIVFHDSNLRVEQWDVSSGKRTSVKEMVIFDGCTQTLLSPDGKTLVCVNLDTVNLDMHVRLRLIDVESGKAFYEKPKFFDPPNFFTAEVLEFEAASGSVAKMLISPDARCLVVTVLNQALIYDLEHRQPVGLAGKLKGLSQARMAFIGSDQLYMATREVKSNGMIKVQIVSFPDGRLLKEVEIGSQSVDAVTKGDLLIISPLKNSAVGLMDPNAATIKVASKLPAIDAYDSLVAEEDQAGGLIVGEIGVPTATRFPLPLGPLPRPRAAAFSPDGKFLVVSTRNRGELWNLETGKQVVLLRPFRSVWIDEGDHMFGQFPKYMDHDPLQFEMTLNPIVNSELGKYEDEDWQYHGLQLHFKPMGKGKSTLQHATLEVRKMGSSTVAWSKDYPKETPACWSAEDNRMVLAWDLSNDSAKQEIKASPVLQHEMDALPGKKKGLLLETVASESGSPLEQVVIPEGDLTGGSDDVRRAAVSGKYVLANGEHGNTVIYRLDTGAKVGEFFGKAVATNAALGLVAAVNRDDEVLLVDEKTGTELKRLSLGSTVRLARIIGGSAGAKDKALLVLTADQVVHRLPLPE